MIAPRCTKRAPAVLSSHSPTLLQERLLPGMRFGGGSKLNLNGFWLFTIGNLKIVNTNRRKTCNATYVLSLLIVMD
jgi:hypothetical protein